MIKVSDFKKEMRYGVPAADQILFNRHYVIGYSYYFRQAKWALEVVNVNDTSIVRADNFRADLRVPERFRADLANYQDSGYDRGHLVASSNQKNSDLQNSETFLLSNIAPQDPQFNRKVWRKLEEAVRNLNAKKKIFETYVVSGPLFYFDQEVEMMDSTKDSGVTLPIPHAFFKTILTENNKGRLHMWSFIIPNESSNDSLKSYQVTTSKVEKISGLNLWENLVGLKIKSEKSKIRKFWG